MNKLYTIVPVVLTLAFGGIYFQHRSTAAEKAAVALAEKTREEAAAAAEKAEAERKAKEDADKREADRRAEEEKKEADKRAKWDADSQRIATETADYRATIATHTATLAQLETELKALRAQKESAIQAGFNYASEVELARIQKRTAELEIQRLVEMIARKGGTTGGLAFAP